MSVKNVKITLNLGLVHAEIESNVSKGMRPLATQILKDCNYYAPDRTNQLISKSCIDFNSDKSEAKLVWGQEYASYVYKGKSKRNKPLKYSKDRNPHAQKEWVKKAKSVKKEQWCKAADKLLKGNKDV